MLEAAIRYAQQGFHIFPITSGAKTPPLTPHGFKDATTDLEQIRKWWTEHPDANIGFWPGGSNLVAIDLDPGHEPMDLPITATVRTPRGEHRYYHSKQVFTNRQLMPHVDVRATNGYTVLPPSKVNGVAYHGDISAWCEELPTWVSEKLGEKPEPRHTEKRIEEIDTKERIARVYELALAAAPAEEFNGSNDATVELINRLLDLCSHEIVLDALLENWMPRCLGEWDAEWLAEKVYSIKQHPDGTWSGRDSDIGCDGWEKPVYPIPAAVDAGSKPRFVRRKPSEYRDLPDPVFWDEVDEKGRGMIPRVDGEGATVLVYGQWGAHKTNITLTWIMDMVAKGARVSYAAGEGARGVGKSRLPAHCRARDIAVETLDTHLDIIEAVPRLADPEDVAAFIAFLHKPDVIVIDTLATATAGEDENSSQFASHLTDNGAIGRIKRAFEATVIVIAHEGKDSSKGARGHSGLSGNVDAGLRVSVPEEKGIRIKVTVDKMRDGEAKFNVFYGIDPDQVPVPRRISEAEFEGRSPRIEREGDLLDEVNMALHALGAHRGSTREWKPETNEGGVEVGELANTVLQQRGEQPTEHKADALRKQLDAAAIRNPIYRVGKGARGHWRWAIHVDEV